MSIDADLDEALFGLAPEEKTLLGVETTFEIEKRLPYLHMIYTNARYAPKNKATDWAKIKAILAERGFVAEAPYDRKVGFYCGDQYVLPNTRLGTLEECRAKGHRVGASHGSVFIK